MKKFAVALNMKARKVNEATLERISHHVDIEDIYVTRTIEQSDQSLDEIIEKRYPLLMCGGGDGTVMRIIEQVIKKVAMHNKSGQDYKVPRFGMLKLGTGNGWSGLLRVPPGVKPIWHVRQNRPEELVYSSFHMIESEGRLFHFGGFGVDALILNDYIELKRKFSSGFMWKLINSLAGYLIAIAFKSLPSVLFKGFKINSKITNLSDEPVYRAYPSREWEELPAKKGEVIFEGPVDATIFGTTSDYGFGLKVMPFAMDKEGYFCIKSTQAGPLHLLRNVKKIWNGTLEGPKIFDFMVKHVKLEIQEDAPFQLGGDPEGYRKSIELKIADFMPELLDFRR